MKNKAFYIISFIFWLLPFITRIFFIEINLEQYDSDLNNTSSDTMNNIISSLSEGNKQNAFILIFFNNLKGCVINIVGGVLLGFGTIINLMINGFYSADIFINSYNVGMSIKSILKVTLPHSFELIGFWLSGAIGFYIAWNIIQFMRGKESMTPNFYKNVGIYSFITFFIILGAAYIEVYVSATIKI